MSLVRSYIGYPDFLGIDLFKSLLMYSNGTICLIKLLFKMGLFTVQAQINSEKTIRNIVFAWKPQKATTTGKTVILKQMLGELYK